MSIETTTELSSISRRRTRSWAFIAALVCLLLPVAAHAQYQYQSDGGYFDLRVDSGGKVKKQKIFWVWAPHYDPGSATYELFAWCTREDQDGNFVGKNKIIFQRPKLVGDGVSVQTPNLVKKLKNGVHAEFISREVSSLGLIAASSATVIGEVTVVIKGKVSAGDRLFCHIDVTETPS